MGKKVAWITDSSVILPNELQGHKDIFIVSLRIIIDQQSYKDGSDMSVTQLFQRMAEEKVIPKTSQPPIGEFVELYEELKETYDCAIAVHISDKLSGTLSTSKQAAKIANFPVEMVDSKTLSYPMGGIIQKGINMIEQGVELVEIISQLQEEATKLETYVMVGSLEQLFRSGRMRSAQFLLGSFLRIKPIISISNGELTIFEKVRTEKRALNRLKKLFDEAMASQAINEIYILQNAARDKASVIKQYVSKKYPQVRIRMGKLGSAIGVHTGPGTLAINWTKDNGS